MSELLESGASAGAADDAASGVAVADEPADQVRGDGVGERRFLRVLCVVLAVVVVILLLLLMRSCSAQDCTLGRDSAAELGQLDGKSAEEIQTELDRVVEEGMFCVSLSSEVEFANGSAEGAVRIENSPANRYAMRVVLSRDDTGQQVYATGLIEPGWHIQEDSLDVRLGAGEYPCTAAVWAHDVDTGDAVGAVYVKVTLRVLG